MKISTKNMKQISKRMMHQPRAAAPFTLYASAVLFACANLMLVVAASTATPATAISLNAPTTSGRTDTKVANVRGAGDHLALPSSEQQAPQLLQPIAQRQSVASETKRATKHTTDLSIGGSNIANAKVQMDSRDMQTAAGHHHGKSHGKYYMYAESPKKGAYKMGFKRGNHKHMIERKESSHKGHVHSYFKWHDKKGKGSHKFEFKHYDKKGKHHHY